MATLVPKRGHRGCAGGASDSFQGQYPGHRAGLGTSLTPFYDLAFSTLWMHCPPFKLRKNPNQGEAAGEGTLVHPLRGQDVAPGISRARQPDPIKTCVWSETRKVVCGPGEMLQRVTGGGGPPPCLWVCA